jgi:hypothetical protein
MSTVEQARRAKEKVKALVAGIQEVRGVGITTVKDAYAVKVNLYHELPDPAAVPGEVDGVRVVYTVVGPAAKQD